MVVALGYVVVTISARLPSGCCMCNWQVIVCKVFQLVE